MGNSQSRRQYIGFAEEAFQNARALERIARPRQPIAGAIVAYGNGSFTARQTIRGCTSIEINEFMKLAPELLARFMAEHIREIPFKSGQCQYPNNAHHNPDCSYCDPALPPEVMVTRDVASYVQSLMLQYNPEVARIAAAIDGGRHEHGGDRAHHHGGHGDHHGHHSGHRSRREPESYREEFDPYDFDDESYSEVEMPMNHGPRGHRGGGHGDGGGGRHGHHSGHRPHREPESYREGIRPLWL